MKITIEIINFPSDRWERFVNGSTKMMIQKRGFKPQMSNNIVLDYNVDGEDTIGILLCEAMSVHTAKQELNQQKNN